MKSVVEQLIEQGHHITEGSASPVQLAHLTSVASQVGARVIGEVGFNAGLSARAFLDAGPEVHVVSFDSGVHPYTWAAKELLDEAYPGRHTLLIGDSTTTLPAYPIKGVFDILFIDGGHQYRTAKLDILNGQRVCRDGAKIIMDDLLLRHSWGRGPFLAWNEMRLRGLIAQDKVFWDGGVGGAQRVWAHGRYQDRKNHRQ